MSKERAVKDAKDGAWTDEAKLELVLEVLAGTQPAATTAQRHGVDPAELESWRSLYVEGLRRGSRLSGGSVLARMRRATRRHPLPCVAGVLAALGVLLAPLTALSENPPGCTQADSPDLCQFQAGEPAVALEVNSNFDKVVGWLQEKVGLVGDSTVTASGDIIAAGTVNAASVTSDGNVNAASLTATGEVSAGTLTLDGNVTSTYNEAGDYSLLPPDFCVVVPRNTSCPTGWHLAHVKWDTEDSDNADSKNGQVGYDESSSASIGMDFCCRGTAWTF